ncbi:peptidase S9 [Aliidongia dinghuensis]|uniref:Peptidase S9 n=1 Tax=Aliidongia dinghuensis TaxID=1867774 RepID=A0A8J3E197_9PROT|nr:S9 family peptidase [Aliidongia dinghuensis]GGE99027.1 peptidase S9 [Aliidongia dinghuensis]
MPSSARPITIDDLWSLKRLGSPTLSPDGRWACAAVTRYDMDKNESTSELWLFATDGRTQRQLTRGRKDADPQWSPDGKWIAFVSKRGETKDADEEEQIYLIAADGGEARRVTNLATGAFEPRWFPDSRRLVFLSWVWPELGNEKAQAKRLRQEKNDKVKATIVEENHYRFWDHWYPRGRKPHLHVVDVETGKTRDLFAGTRFYLPAQDPGAGMFDISPDGREIAFAYDFDPDPRAFSLTQIVALEVKSGKWTNLTGAGAIDGERINGTPRYSPDGKWLAFLSSHVGKRYNEQDRAWLIDRANGRISPLTEGWDRGVAAPLVWAADSQSLYFAAESEVAQPIWRIGLAGGTPEELVRGPGHGGTAGDLCLSADGRTLVYARSSLSHPPALFAAASDGSRERAIERLNAKLLHRLALGQSQSVTIKGSDGDPVQMWVMTPPGFDAAKPGKAKWPLMQVIHGGPHTCVTDGWHWRWNMQLFAAAGYVVAAVNYHGSTGRGQAFVSSINADWGRRELADIEAGTDHMLATGTIDPDRVVATGGSYGGYMVAYMNGNVRGDRYKAYVCHAGCFDWVSMMGSDGYFWLGKELGAFAWEDEAAVLRQSPHHYARHFATPTLVMHGELDYRVPYYQGLAYYNTLRAKDVPARLVFFPDENHWILKPQNSRLWYKEFVDWCNRHTARKKPRRK